MSRDARHILIVALVLAAFGGLMAPVGHAENQSAPVAMVSSTVDAVLTVLRDDSLSDPVRRSRIEEIAYARFDFDTIHLATTTGRKESLRRGSPIGST